MPNLFRLVRSSDLVGAKLSGILLRCADDAVIIGFGVNLAHQPEGLDRPATSVVTLAGSSPDAGSFLETLAENFARWLQRWRTEGATPIRDRWLLAARSDERRVGQACVSPCRSRWSAYN